MATHLVTGEETNLLTEKEVKKRCRAKSVVVTSNTLSWIVWGDNNDDFFKVCQIKDEDRGKRLRVKVKIELAHREGYTLLMSESGDHALLITKHTSKQIRYKTIISFLPSDIE